jgi:anti-sigma regulatory factor (Ser/Thr protein kinase)
MSVNYLEFITQRQRDQKYKDKKVSIKFTFNSDRVIYVIEDEGDGFDYRNILEKVKRVNQSELSHGRGLTMALGVFDMIRFNDKGNKVTLVKRFSAELDFESEITV